MGHGISGKALDKFMKQKIPWSKIIRKAANADRGTRLWPTDKSQDSAVGFRFDAGSKKDGKTYVILQANKNAADKSVKKAAQENSHQTIAQALVDPNADEEEEKEKTKKKIKDSFTKNK